PDDPKEGAVAAGAAAGDSCNQHCNGSGGAGRGRTNYKQLEAHASRTIVETLITTQPRSLNTPTYKFVRSTPMEFSIYTAFSRLSCHFSFAVLFAAHRLVSLLVSL
ncbi:unnamed protein product, partial [Ectocarpus sp. 4 AP-2014]